ncbi:MAG: hypothetical protein H7A25_16315 [Leptospiraceae bacterium]|nr:hypothetical protein [Leptospiraceae bacterium]MCP5501467.1 hypothetical protein [Leptospiraceae bacterium]
MKIVSLKSFSLIAIISAFITFSCSADSTKEAVKETKAGGMCEYREIKGFAVIDSIKKPAEAVKGMMKEPREVIYHFEPEDKGTEYKFPTWKDTGLKLTIAGGLAPPLDCLKKQKITVGSKHKALRTEITKGTCTPVVFILTGFDENLCFE